MTELPTTGWTNEEAEAVAEEGSALIGMEANLEVPPVFMLAYSDSQRDVAECTTLVVTAQGERIEQYWRISIPKPYTLPGSFDQDVWVAVQALVNRRGGMPPDGKLYFSMYELLEIMGRDHRGRHYDQIQESLERLAATTIYSDNAFYSADVGTYERITFHPWAVRFTGSYDRKRGRASERHELEFHSLVRRSFQSRYTKLLDAEFYYSLRSPLAKRLFRLIDRKRAGKRTWSTGVTKLQELMPLTENYRFPSQIKRALKPAHKELLDREYLEEVWFEKTKSGERVHYKISAQWDRSRGINGAESEPSDEEKRVTEMLQRCGVWSNVAPDLVRRHGPEVCARYAQALPEMKGVEDPGAWLRWAIETEFTLPNHLQAQPSLLGDGSDEQDAKTNCPASDGSPSNGNPEGAALPTPTDEAARTWRQALADAGLNEDKASVSAWFEHCVPAAFDGDTLTLVAPNERARYYIEKRFGERIQEALKQRPEGAASLSVVEAGEYATDALDSSDFKDGYEWFFR